MNIFFTSDTHAYHKNICKGVTLWDSDDLCRDFEDETVMTETLIDNINSVVGEKDILYHLGDWSFGGKDKVYEFRKRLRVKTIHLILGNHDKHIRNNGIIKADKYLNIQSLFTSVSELKDKKIMGQNIMMCHYPMRTWHKAASGSWMLFGHCHGNLPPHTSENGVTRYKTLDVGIDTHPEFRPYHFEEIKQIFESDLYLNCNIDHH